MLIATTCLLGIVAVVAFCVVCKSRAAVKESARLYMDLYSIYSDSEKEHLKTDRKLSSEIEAYTKLCLHGRKDLVVAEGLCSFRVEGRAEGKSFVIKIFTYEYGNAEDEDFARRQAEELKEIIEKF